MSQGHKGSRHVGGTGEKLFRSEWRVTSPTRAPRMEVFDISFSRNQEVQDHLSSKLKFALQQLKNNVLRYGENAEFSKVYFAGMN